MVSVFDHGAPDPCPTPFNLAAHVLAAGARTPDKTALSLIGPAGGEHWTYAQLRAAVFGTAKGLQENGLESGDILLMRLGNTVDFPIAFLGAIAAGVVPVPTSAQLTEHEVRGILAHLRPKAILHDTRIACPVSDVPIFDLETARSWRGLASVDPCMSDPNQLAYIIYTSGTSGVPRAVGHAHRAIWARQMMMQGWYGLGPDDRLLHAGAFNWTYTLGTGLMDPWTMGATALIPQADLGTERLPTALRDGNATIFAAAPGVYRNILKHHMNKVPTLRHGLAAGEKLSSHIRDAWQAATGTPVFEAYGMSECSTFISASPSRPARDETLGTPQTGRRVAILGDDGPVLRGETGVIAIHRDDPGLMLGYIGADQETADKFRGDWFVTGDQGIMHTDDQITYLGRDDDMMNAGGYRVSPIEVEQALAGYPGIQEVGVTDVALKPDVTVIAAFYTANTDIPEDQLRDWANRRLARYKQPRLYLRLRGLPRNPNGKLVRRALRDHTPDVG